MNWFEALVLGLVQGLTEYLPVSSSGHLAIGAYLFGINGEDNLTFTIMVHVATVLSTLVILLSLIHISEPTRLISVSRMPSSA